MGKSVRTGLSSCEKRIYRAAVSQRLRHTALERNAFSVTGRYKKEQRAAETIHSNRTVRSASCNKHNVRHFKYPMSLF